MIRTIDPKKFNDIRILRVSGIKDTAVYASSDEAGIVSKNNSIICGKDGNRIQGPLHIMASPSDIKIGGMWSLNPMLISTVPSTLVTPVPVFVFSFPGLSTAKKISDIVSVMGLLMA